MVSPSPRATPTPLPLSALVAYGWYQCRVLLVSVQLSIPAGSLYVPTPLYNNFFIDVSVLEPSEWNFVSCFISVL